MGSQILNNRYCLLHCIKQNHFSEIFLASDLTLQHQKCIIKKLLANVRDLRMTKIRKALFEQEARILKRIKGKHELIPQFYEYFVDSGCFYLAQEWIKGITLQEQLKKKKKLSELETRKILVDLLSILDCIHSLGIVHRDLKPNNIILRSTDRLPVLIDFGVAKEIEQETASQKLLDFPRVGTPGYMSPEQIMGKTVYSSDLYSLGSIAIQLLTGISPQDLIYQPDTLARFWHPIKLNLNSNLGEVIERAIDPNPQARFTSAREMLSVLKSPSTTYLMTQKINIPSKPVKSEVIFNFERISWFFWLIFVGELVFLWFGLHYLIPTPDYRSSISNLGQSSYPESPIVMPTYNSSESDDFADLPLFTTGTEASTILIALGEPVWRKPGYWTNSIAWNYQDVFQPGIDLGYLFDRSSQTLRQTEIALPPTIKLATLKYTLQTFLQNRDTQKIQQGLTAVYYRQTTRYSFTLNNLEGIIERNDKDRLYIGVWEADFH
jgi:serine/threonine-protein kinase